MRLTLWKYRCGACGGSYELPGADLTFSYGVFLARSITGAVAIYEATTDGAFMEVRNLLERDARVASRPPRRRAALLREVFPVVLDPANDGSEFVIEGSPGCPSCTSRLVAEWEDTGVAAPGRSSVSRTHWDSLNAAQRMALIEARLDAVLAQLPFRAGAALAHVDQHVRVSDGRSEWERGYEASIAVQELRRSSAPAWTRRLRRVNEWIIVAVTMGFAVSALALVMGAAGVTLPAFVSGPLWVGLSVVAATAIRRSRH